MSGQRIAKLRQIRADHTAGLIDGMWVDVTTASALIAVHDALNPDNQARFDSIPLMRLVDFAWKQVTPVR